MKNKDGDTCYKMAFGYGSCRIGTLLTLSEHYDNRDSIEHPLCHEFYRHDNGNCPSYDEVCTNRDVFQVIS